MPNEELEIEQLHHQYKEKKKILSHARERTLNKQNKQKETCQKKDTQNTKDNISSCFMII